MQVSNQRMNCHVMFVNEMRKCISFFVNVFRPRPSHTLDLNAISVCPLDRVVSEVCFLLVGKDVKKFHPF